VVKSPSLRLGVLTRRIDLPRRPHQCRLEQNRCCQGADKRQGKQLSVSGFFPINKFSSAPLLMEAARVAQTRSGGDDVKKRLMVVPDVHVTRLVTDQRNGKTVVTAVLLQQFGAEVASIGVPATGPRCTCTSTTVPKGSAERWSTMRVTRGIL
jgi:hypothetical protein